jgi:hypothetical protein
MSNDSEPQKPLPDDALTIVARGLTRKIRRLRARAHYDADISVRKIAINASCDCTIVVVTAFRRERRTVRGSSRSMSEVRDSPPRLDPARILA